MGGSSKGGTQETKVELPPEIKEAAIDNLDIANEVAAIGYTPYRGPTVAEFNPQQKSGMMAYDQAASAFGMPSAVDWNSRGNPQPETAYTMRGEANPTSGKGGALSKPQLGNIDPAEIAAAVAGPQPSSSTVSGGGGSTAAPTGGGSPDLLSETIAPTPSPHPPQYQSPTPSPHPEAAPPPGPGMMPPPQVQTAAPQQPTGGMSAPPGMSTDDIFAAMTGMQPAPPTSTMGGLTGYSPAPAYDEALANMPPAQKAAIESFVMDPVTGEAPTNVSVPKPKTSFVQNEDGSIGVKPTAPPPKPNYSMNDAAIAAQLGMSPAQYAAIKSQNPSRDPTRYFTGTGYGYLGR